MKGVGAGPHQGLIDCRLCPRLVEWRELKASTEKRAAFSDEDYWGRPVPSRGSLDAPGLIVGLAPAAHGANRTGRMFSGDRSGQWLFGALHKVGLATSPIHDDPDLELVKVRITAVCHCPPPDNRPTAQEVATCVDTWLIPEIEAVSPRVVVCLGGLAWNTVLRLGAASLGWEVPRPRPRFGHLSEVEPGRGPVVIGSYHPSQQNTFTGKLTETMFDRVWVRVAELVTTG
ncbi:MAG: uracil-DNA glycosylase [Acidimicrobiia bacterium]